MVLTDCQVQKLVGYKAESAAAGTAWRDCPGETGAHQEQMGCPA
jgi:hypothetical protein